MSGLWVSLLFASLTCVLVAPHRAAAQSPAPVLMTMSLIDVKPEFTSDFGALQAEVMAAQREGGQPWRETWHTATFGHPYRVAVFGPVEGLGQLDGPTFTVKGAGPARATTINERARRMIERQQIYLLQTRPDLGMGTRPAKPSLAVASFISVAPGREPELEQFLKTDVRAALKKAGVTYYGVARVTYGGDTSQYLTLLNFENFTDLGRGHPLDRALGAEGAMKLQTKVTGIVTKLERYVIRFNEVLSFRQP